MLWVDHLESMEYLRGSVNLRAYGQRDPLMEYRKEGLRLFKELEETLAGRVLEFISRVDQQALQTSPQTAVAQPRAIGVGHMQEVIGRNDPCTCGSGKKWKNCGLKNTEEHQQKMKHGA